MTDRHGWNSWEQYQSVHYSYLRAYEHFVLDPRYEPTTTNTSVAWKGVLYCVDGIEILASKTQAVVHQGGQPMVRTTDYSYHVLRRSGGVTTNLFRYDNIGNHGAPDRHHRHRFSENGDEIQPPQAISEAEWPTLGDVIKEACQCWEQQRTD